MGNDSNNTQYKYIVSIDFGSAGVGYAYETISNNKKAINPVLSNFKGQGDNKVPNEIILGDNDEVLAFGNECSTYINNHKNTQESYLYFKDIKMNLYNKNYFIKATNQKEFPIEIIISKILKEISDDAIKQIQKNKGGEIKKDKIKWVVTIPAIWTEKSKEIMLKASKKAGLINDNTDLSLFFALEPEVAGIFYFSDLNSEVDSEKKEKELNNPFIICDIGGGTVDICTLKKETKKDTLIEEYPPIGGDYGGNYINKEFMKRLIIELFGEKRLEKAKNDEKYIEFENNIEKLKKDLEDGQYDCTLNCEIFKENINSSDNELNYYIEEFNKKAYNFKYKLKRGEKYKWDLIFPSQIFLDITKEIADKIFLKLLEVYQNFENVQTVFTGAGSNNKVLIQYIQQNFESKRINFDNKTTIQPEISILKGAVIYGLQNNIIRKRKPKYTIGINVSKTWNDALYKDGGKKIYNNTDKEYKCYNLFKKFITRNEYITFDEIISHDFIANGGKPIIGFYKTLKNDCKYIDEKDEKGNLIIKKFGFVKFEIEDYDRNNPQVKINMKMGGTYIYATAIYLKTRNDIKITQNFEDEKDQMIDP
jgi:hypothetical protein